MEKGLKLGIIIIGCVILLAILLIMNPFVVIQTGERGVVLHWGEVSGIFEPGIHFRIPVADKIVPIDVTTHKAEAPASASSSDLQLVSSKVVVNYNLDPRKVDFIYSTFRGNQDDVLITPSIQESVKAVTARYTAEQLITKREAVRDEIQANITRKLAKNDIIVSGVAITNFQFSESFENAIEAKVTAEQNALAAKNKLEQVRYEADQRVAQAEAEAKAIKIQAEAITQQGGANYVQLQAIQKWNGALPQQFVPGSAIPFLNITKN